MSKAQVAIVLCTVILLTSGIVFAVIVLLMRLKTGGSFESILVERKQLFRHSIVVAIALLVVAAVALIIRNNT